MASNFQLNIPEQTTPTKLRELCNELLSSPLSLKPDNESMVSMVNTGGVHIASLKTPTKGFPPKNIAPKHLVTLPSKIYIKVSQQQYFQPILSLKELSSL